MEPQWNGISVKLVGGKMHDKYKCHQCDKNCILVVSVSDDPPEKCPKDYNKIQLEVSP